MSSKNKSLLIVAPLFLVLFIDGMGLGLLFPILNTIIIDPASVFLPIGTTVVTRDFLYGLTVGIFMICWFFGAAILGDLSDTVGRKKSLMICLMGSFFGYSFSAIAIIFHSLLVLILGRVIAGFTAGSQPIAQAAIVDVSGEEHKARNIGLILLAVSLGFVFGPIFGGILSDQALVSWFTYSTPLYFASFISLLNAILLWLFFEETFYKTGKISIKLHHAIYIFISAFKHKNIWKLSIMLLVMIFGWSNYFTFISLYMFKKYHFQTIDNALFLAVMGLGFSIGCGYLVDVCANRFKFKNTVIVSLLITTVAVVGTIFFEHAVFAWLCVFIIGIALAVAYSTILAIFSNQVGADEQGWVMGVTGSIMALCFGLTSLFTGVIADIGVGVPMYLAALGLAGSAAILMFIHVQY